MKYHRKPGASWFRFTPTHFYCRECRIEVRHVLTPLGYAIWALLLCMFALACYAVFSRRSWGPFYRHREYFLVAWLLSSLPLCLIQAKWGMRLALVTRAAHDAL